MALGRRPGACVSALLALFALAPPPASSTNGTMVHPPSGGGPDAWADDAPRHRGSGGREREWELDGHGRARFILEAPRDDAFETRKEKIRLRKGGRKSRALASKEEEETAAIAGINSTAPFSFLDAQQAYATCSPTAPGVQEGKYITWKSTSALGNGLNIFAQTMLYALVSGRQIVVGHGRVPELMCSPETGAFECGLPFHSTFLSGTYDELEKRKNSPQWHWEGVFDKTTPVHISAIKWYAWRSVADNLYFGRTDQSTEAKRRDMACVFKALRCSKGDTHFGKSDPSLTDARATCRLRPHPTFNKLAHPRA